jgi:molybdopterin-guanine dinucleotide biosynthesis protein A
MAQADKGLLVLHGKPLVSWVLERIIPQVDEAIISANRGIDQYASLGCPVISDTLTEFAGPLAGVQRGMLEARHPLVLCVPCDMPFLPADLVTRLLAALDGSGADLAVPASGDDIHRALMLVRRDLAANLETFLAGGGRKVSQWQGGLKQVVVPFVEVDAFLNVNTPEQMQEVERRLVVPVT